MTKILEPTSLSKPKILPEAYFFCSTLRLKFLPYPTSLLQPKVRFLLKLTSLLCPNVRFLPELTSLSWPMSDSCLKPISLSLANVRFLPSSPQRLSTEPWVNYHSIRVLNILPSEPWSHIFSPDKLLGIYLSFPCLYCCSKCRLTGLTRPHHLAVYLRVSPLTIPS